MSVFNKVAKAGFWIYFKIFGVQIINLVAIAILARQLTPAAFGLVALANMVLKFLNSFSSQGINQFILYDKEEGAEERANAAFWLSLFISILTVGIGFAIAPFLGDYFKEPELFAIVAILLLRYPLDAMSKIPDAILNKDLKFMSIEIRDFFIKLVAAALSVIMALNGYGVYSLIIPVVALSPVRLVMSFMVSGWLPKKTLGTKDWGRIFKYSSNVMGSTFTNFILTQGDTFLVGKLLGTGALGFYNFSWQASNLVTRTIVQVSNKLSMPALRNFSDDRKKLKGAMIKILEFLSSVTFPMLFGLFVLADEFILLLYGEKWHASIIPLRILLIYSIRYAVGSPLGAFFKIIGKPKINFYIGLAIIPFYLFAIWFGSKSGIIGVAWGVSITRTLFGLIPFYIASRLLQISFWEILKPMKAAFFASILMAASVYGFKYALYSVVDNMMIVFVLSIILGSISYFILIKFVFRDVLNTYAWYVKKIFGKARKYQWITKIFS